jgi:hypothetical protein
MHPPDDVQLQPMNMLYEEGNDNNKILSYYYKYYTIMWHVHKCISAISVESIAEMHISKCKIKLTISSLQKSRSPNSCFNI